MLKPPINDLVEKITDELGDELGAELGNRYSLVLAIAKRARVIASTEGKAKEKEPVTFETRLSDRYRKTKEIIKPIHKAIDEFEDNTIEVYHRSPEEMKSEEATLDKNDMDDKPSYIPPISFLNDDE